MMLTQMALETKMIYVESEDFENFKVILDGGELPRNINNIHSVTNAKRKIISSISMWNIVNQLGKMGHLKTLGTQIG